MEMQATSAQPQQARPRITASSPCPCCLLSAVCFLLSAVCCLLPAACCLLPAACCVLSAVINKQLWGGARYR